MRLTVAAAAAEASELEAIARELLARLELQVEFRRVERIQVAELRQPTSGYFARVWIALDARGKARLYLEHSARDRLLLRDVAGDSQNPELLREELGHILQAALEGLKAGEEIGEPRQEALADVEPPAAEIPPKPAAASPLPSAVRARPSPPGRASALRFGLRYEVAVLGDRGAVEDGPGAAVWLSLPARPRWSLGLFGAYHRPFRVERAPIGARFQSWTLGAELTLEAWRTASSRLRLGAGVAANLVQVTSFESASSRDDVELAPSAWRKLPVGRAQLTYSHQLTSVIALDAALGVEVEVSGSRYLLQTSESELEVLAPWPVRPLLSLGVSVP